MLPVLHNGFLLPAYQSVISSPPKSIFTQLTSTYIIVNFKNS